MKHKRNIMGAADYSISTLQSLKKALIQAEAKNKEMVWAVGGLVLTLTGSLLKICDSVIQEAQQKEIPSAKTDLLEIKDKFNQLIDAMVDSD